MPYFQRMPYAGLHPLPGSEPDHSAEPSPRAPEASPLVEKAAAIFREESHSLPDWRPAAGSLAMPPIQLSEIASAASAANAAVRLCAAPAQAGQLARIPIALINESTDDVPYAFTFTDLVSSTGNRIPFTAIVCAPENATVPGGGTLDAEFKIQIPSVPGGQYFGLVTCRETHPAILSVIVSA